MINARDGQIVLIRVAESGFVAQQQRLHKTRRIGRERGLDRRSEPFRQHSRRQPDGSASRLGVQRPAAACRQKNAARQIVILAAQMLFLRRGELRRAGQEASGPNFAVGFVKVNDCRTAFSVQRQPGGDGLPVAARLRSSQRLRGKCRRFAGKRLKWAQKKRLVPPAPGKSGQKTQHADRGAVRNRPPKQKQQRTHCRKRGKQHTRRGMQQNQIQSGGHGKAAGKQAEPSHRPSPSKSRKTGRTASNASGFDRLIPLSWGLPLREPLLSSGLPQQEPRQRASRQPWARRPRQRSQNRRPWKRPRSRRALRLRGGRR